MVKTKPLGETSGFVVKCPTSSPGESCENSSQLLSVLLVMITLCLKIEYPKKKLGKGQFLVAPFKSQYCWRTTPQILLLKP